MLFSVARSGNIKQERYREAWFEAFGTKLMPPCLFCVYSVLRGLLLGFLACCSGKGFSLQNVRDFFCILSCLRWVRARDIYAGKEFQVRTTWSFNEGCGPPGRWRNVPSLVQLPSAEALLVMFLLHQLNLSSWPKSISNNEVSSTITFVSSLINCFTWLWRL